MSKDLCIRMTDAELLVVLFIQQLGWASYIHRIETLHPFQMTVKESLDMLAHPAAEEGFKL